MFFQIINTLSIISRAGNTQLFSSRHSGNAKEMEEDNQLINPIIEEMVGKRNMMVTAEL